LKIEIKMNHNNYKNIMLFLMVLSSIILTGQTTAIRAGKLIHPETSKIENNQIIIIEAGKITYVGKEIPNIAIDTIYDLSSSYVLPGLMDAHTHLTAELPNHPGIDESESTFGVPYYFESTSLRAIRGLQNSKLLLESGFTTIRDVGNEADYAMTDVEKAIKLGWFDGPTLFHAGKIIAPFGGQSSFEPPERGDSWKLEYLDADTHDEIRKAIRKNIYYGANIIKLVTGDQSYFYTEEDIRVAVEEAHRAGLTIAVHAMEGEPAKNAILAGVNSIEHGLTMSDELLQLMKDKNVVLVATEFPEEHNVLYYGGKRDLAKQDALLFIDRLKRAYKIGVKLAFGTDVYYKVPNKNRIEANYDFLEMWTMAKIPDDEILKAMTTHIAQLLEIENERGKIKINQFADIIALKQNPLEDINAIKSVHFVMKEGKVIRNKE
jgi:imidazolonepropionase-like amidohydrolase